MDPGVDVTPVIGKIRVWSGAVPVKCTHLRPVVAELPVPGGTPYLYHWGLPTTKARSGGEDEKGFGESVKRVTLS